VADKRSKEEMVYQLRDWAFAKMRKQARVLQKAEQIYSKSISMVDKIAVKMKP